ncbi:hypothetical protein ACFLQ2_00900 [archaeon]
MQRGQAFDAFKLLIAAVVAGAILVILLNIIGGITIASEDPLRVMGQELKEVRGGGRASVSNVVRFNEDEEFFANAVARAAELNEYSVGFCCEGSSMSQCTGYEFSEAQFECTEGTATTEGHLAVKSDVSGSIRAYCPSGRGELCSIGFRAER